MFHCSLHWRSKWSAIARPTRNNSLLWETRLNLSKELLQQSKSELYFETKLVHLRVRKFFPPIKFVGIQETHCSQSERSTHPVDQSRPGLGQPRFIFPRFLFYVIGEGSQHSELRLVYAFSTILWLLNVVSVSLKRSNFVFFRTNQKQALERDHLMVSTSCRLACVLLHLWELNPVQLLINSWDSNSL